MNQHVTANYYFYMGSFLRVCEKMGKTEKWDVMVWVLFI